MQPFLRVQWIGGAALVAAWRYSVYFCIVLMVLGTILSASAAETSTPEKEKNPPETGLLGQLRRQPGVKQAEYDDKVAITDVDAAQRELEGLNNTVSNSMYLAEQSKRAEETDHGVFTSIAIAAIVLGGGILFFRNFGPRLAFLFKLPEEEADGSQINAAEEKSFSEFATAFKVGPTPHRRASANPGGSEFTLNESFKTSEFVSVTPPPLKIFFDSAPTAVAVMRSVIQEITRACDLEARQKLLTELCKKIHDLKGVAELPEILPVWQLAAALEGLVKQLSDKERNVTPSTLRTVASAVDLLEALSVRGIRSDLLSEPPVRFLAVDDDSISRHAVSFALKKALNKPDLAENGEAALALVSHIKYDAIFLDVQMPGMNGFEVCSSIHRTELNRATPVVFVTCQSDFDARAKSTLSGGNDLIGKPFLTFEITVKALTLALRSRLKPTTDGTANQVNEKAQPSREIVTPLVIEKEHVVKTGEVTRETGQTSAGHQTPTHKSREERRRDRRRIAQLRQGKRNRGRHGKPHENDSLNLSSDLVANAFLAHAPANIEMLQDRIEHIYEATDDEFRKEILVELYLAVHSLTAEANLAKLQTFFQLSSAIEVLLKKLVEDPTDSIISSLSVVTGALELLHDFCDAKLTANLAEKAMDIDSSSPAEVSLGVLTSTLSTRFEQLISAHDSDAELPIQELAALEK